MISNPVVSRPLKVDSSLLFQGANVFAEIGDLILRQLAAIFGHLVFALRDDGEDVGIGLFLDIRRGQVADLQVLAHGRVAGGVLAVAHGALGLEGRGAFIAGESRWHETGENERDNEDCDEKLSDL